MIPNTFGLIRHPEIDLIAVPLEISVKDLKLQKIAPEIADVYENSYILSTGNEYQFDGMCYYSVQVPTKAIGVIVPCSYFGSVSSGNVASSGLSTSKNGGVQGMPRTICYPGRAWAYLPIASANHKWVIVSQLLEDYKSGFHPIFVFRDSE